MHHSEPIITMLFQIMIIQSYHIISITDNRPTKLSYRLVIWYLDFKQYRIISNVIIKFLKYFISYQKRYFNFKNYHIKKDISIFKIIKNYISIFKLSFYIENYISISKLKNLVIKTNLNNSLISGGKRSLVIN